MALVKKITHQILGRDSAHKVVGCTYSLVTGDDGVKILQLDTYGSAERKMKGKKSQSIRFTPDAIEQLKKIIKDSGI